MKDLIPFFLAFFLSYENVSGQSETEAYSNKIFSSDIKTVQFYVDPLVLTDPVIPLVGPSQLHLEFDDLKGGKEDYYYTVVQCNYDWTPSELSQYDYLSGFTEQEIRDYQFSYNTNQTFTHYEALFPSPDFRITKSGNYILKVFKDDDPEQVILTKRFVVSENIMEIVSDVTIASDVRNGRTHQQVDFSIIHRGNNISNAFSEIKVTLLQNFRWDNAIENLQPQFVKPDQIDYNFSSQTAFPAGKEFRYFDTRTLRYKTDRVQEISGDDKSTSVILFPDENRSNAQPTSRHDINGKFIPGTQDYADEDLRADYVTVKFSLPVDYPFKDGKIFVVGGFNDWQRSNEFRLQYNPASKAYELTLLLKQGYYEYEYYFESGDKNEEPDASSLFEGNSTDTENAYQIIVYYRPFGTRYDRAVAFKSTDTFNR